MSVDIRVFSPTIGTGVQITAVAATSTVGVIDVNRAGQQIVVTNLGTDVAYVRTYDSENGVDTATSADYPVLGGTQIVLTKDPRHNSMAILSAGTPIIHIIKGNGI